MKLDVPFYSQKKSDHPDALKSCSVFCVKMILAFLTGKDKFPFSILIEEKNFLSKNLPDYGATLSSVTALLRNNNVVSYFQEFKSHPFSLESKKTISSKENEELMFLLFLKKVKKKIDNNLPVIVSVAKDFKEDFSKGHQVLVTGYEEKNKKIVGLFLNDPNLEKEEGKNLFIEKDIFFKNWKKMAIFLEK